LDRVASARDGCLGAGEGLKDDAGGVFIDPLRGGKLVNAPSPVGMGMAEETVGCNGGVVCGFVNVSSYRYGCSSALRRIVLIETL